MKNTTELKVDDKKVYLETMGCQMNKLDSELVISQLTDMGYEMTDEIDEAGVVIYNTCSVRHHAEEKVISKIGKYKHRSKKDPKVTLAVIGCMAQRLGAKLQEEHRHVDITCGPGQIHRLGEEIVKHQELHRPVMLRNSQADVEKLEELDAARKYFDRDQPFSAYVRVIRGCSKFCHFCVVPFTRGLESSRPIDNIFEESRKLVEQGVKEITLLGQTVNSYHYVNGKSYTLADVMERLHDLDGLERIRFVTSYPTDFHDQIMQAMADLPKVCEYLHMPAQHGSDAVLKRMNRHYELQEYIDLIAKYREKVPNIAIASDIIVGFCGETDEEFEETKALLQRIRFKNNFIFQYSPRPKTNAEKNLPDDVPLAVKKRRNHELIALQKQISEEDNQRFIGQTLKVFIEGPSKKPHLGNWDRDKDPPPNLHAIQELSPSQTQLQLVGRTAGDYITVFNGTDDMAGQTRSVKIYKASAMTLFGELVP